ncbi:MAG: phosphoglycerate mutase family protein [Pseudomonadota bacterium]
MKRMPASGWLASLFMLITTVACSVPAVADQQDTRVQQAVTTVYLIRHTEKELNSGKDPKLTEQGHYRAKNWAKIFSDTRLDAVYSTDTIRTRSTAQPIADAQGREVTLYQAFGVDFAEFVQQHQHQAVLVVGHSNTIPAFANGLIGKEKYSELDESNYDTLFIVDITNGTRTAKLLNIEAQMP